MDWIQDHPYLSTLTAAGILLFVGGVIVFERMQTVTSSGVSTWSTATFDLTNVVSTSNTNATDPASIMQQALNTTTDTLPAPNYVPPTTSSTSQSTADEGAFDYNSFLASLTQAGTTSHKIQSSSSTSDILASTYAFIPQGLISTTTISTPNRTAAQEALYQYGNEVGGFIQSYDKFHTNATNILQDQISDRNNADKIAAVEKLGQDLIDVGDQFNNVTDVPPTALAAHKALAASYIDIGKKLQKVPQTSYDSDFVAAVNVYDSAVDVYTKNFVQLAFIFSANGVTFTPSDPGSVFTFTQSTL